MKRRIRDIFKESIEVKRKCVADNSTNIAKAVRIITKAMKKGKKAILFGNGGSAADAQHISAEFVGRFKKERKALGAIALTTDTSALTALTNDYSYDIVFSRQLEALGQKGDVAIGITTTGNSQNVVEGIKKAREMGIATIAFTGCGGGKLKNEADISLIVPSDVTARIQESHITMAHTICELVEESFD